MPRENDKKKRLQRNDKIIQDYCSGLSYSELSEKYDLSTRAIVPILNNDLAKKVRETVFLKRAALLPKVYEKEMELLDCGDKSIELRAAHKLIDDMGIGSSHTPHSVAVNIFNQQIKQISDFMLHLVSRYAQEAINKADGKVIEAEYTEDSTNLKGDN